MTKLLDIPALTPGRVTLENLFTGQARRIAFALGSAKYELQLQPAPNGPRASNHGLQFRLNSEPVWIGFNALSPLTQLAPDFKEVALEELPGDVQLVLLETLLEPFLNAFEKAASGAKIELDSLAPKPPQAPLPQSFQWTLLRDQSPFLAGTGALSSACLEIVAPLIKKAPISISPEVQQQADALRFALRFQLGETHLSVAEFRLLGLNDILLLEGSALPLRGAVYIGEKARFFADFHERSVTLAAMETAPVRPATSPAPAPGGPPGGMTGPVSSAATAKPATAAATPLQVEDLPVHITFDVGHKTLSLAEIKSLQTGFVFELENPVERPVILRAAGQQVGEGELVQVGGRIGVRILSLQLDSAA